MSSFIQTNQVVIVPVGITTTLFPADSGKIFLLQKSAAGLIVQLPAVAISIGVTYKFIQATAAAQTARIQAAAGTPIIGHVIQGPLVGATVQVGAGTIAVNFASTTVIGDVINMYCDGTNWLTSATSGSNASATGITFSA